VSGSEIRKVNEAELTEIRGLEASSSDPLKHGSRPFLRPYLEVARYVRR
jgi:hypothetical protein